jgi:hypothetical protein
MASRCPGRSGRVRHRRHPSNAATVKQKRPRSPAIYISVRGSRPPAMTRARHRQRPLASRDPTCPVSRGRRSSSGAGLLRRELFPRASTPADAVAIHARCLVRAHYAIGDAMAEGPIRRRRNCRRLHPVRTNRSGWAALAGPRYARRANTGRLAPPFPRGLAARPPRRRARRSGQLSRRVCREVCIRSSRPPSLVPGARLRLVFFVTA